MGSLAPQFFLAYNYYYLYILIYGILNFGTTTGSHSLTSSQTETINRNWRASRHLPTPPNGSQACVCVCSGWHLPSDPWKPLVPASGQLHQRSHFQPLVLGKLCNLCVAHFNLTELLADLCEL